MFEGTSYAKASRGLPQERRMTMTTKTVNNKMRELEQLEQEKKELESRIAKIKEQVQGEFGDSEILETSQYIIRWTLYTSNKFDAKEFKADHGKMFQKYLTETEGRRFSYAAR